MVQRASHSSGSRQGTVGGLSMHTVPQGFAVPPACPPPTSAVPPSPPEGTGGTPWQDLEEDLAECIAVFQESNGSYAHGLEFQWRSSSQQRSQNASSVAEEHLKVLGSPVLAINVGGKVFLTTASTLRKAPFFDSMLRLSEEGQLGMTVDDGGRFFVDRSGELFYYILDYLRSGHWLLRERAADLEFVDALREEATFYGLDQVKDRMPMPRISEFVTIWQFRDDTSIYVDCLEQTIRQDPDHQGLFRLCKYSGGLPLDMQTCTKRFKATSHSVQSVVAYFAMRGFTLQQVLEGSMITHTTSADGQSRNGLGTQYMLWRSTSFPSSMQQPDSTPASWIPS
uniref:BTB domain-containing protein n=1 Tax=Alexandrium monilatum TaxID=311494 RepID=A0A7S4R2J7_9DINO